MKLKIAQHVKLHGLVFEEYTKNEKTDPEFAAYASEKLGFQVGTAHVMQARSTYGIDSLREVKRNSTPTTIMERLCAAEKAIAEMQGKWADLEGKKA